MSQPTSTLQHDPDRDTWQCRDCAAAEWPCEPARERLTGEFDSVTSLRMYLMALAAEALPTLAAMDASEVYLRFLGWVRARR